MPTRQGGPNAWQRALGRVVDVIAKGNNYNPQTGKYSNVGRGLLGGVGQAVATYFGGPLVGAAVGQLANNYANNNNPLNFAGNDSRLAQLANALTGAGQDGQIGAVTREPFSPSRGFDIPGFGAGGIMPPHMNPGVAAPWQGLGTSTGNVFGGGQLGNWSNAGGAAPRGFGQAAGSFTPAGAGVVQVAGQGWGGSDAAAGFGLGAQGAGSSSGGSYAVADAMRAAAKNRV